MSHKIIIFKQKGLEVASVNLISILDSIVVLIGALETTSSLMDGSDGSDVCRSTHLINGDGIFDAAGIDNFMKEVKLAECGLSYAVVSIMGLRSCGKSTLLNHLFHTNFREMDALNGRSQTTQGIWLARCVGIDPCTLVMDLEGTDGIEREENDTAFEKQIALFALAVSDIVLINMWCHDIGREQAANKPLIKTVFQVMMRLFTPRKTTLMFVIRDKTRIPFETLNDVLREDIQMIWDSVPKPEAHKETPLSEFFRVEVVALNSFEEKEEQFKEQVADLRRQFFHSIVPGGLAGDRREVVAASGFCLKAQKIWETIKENKDLHLPPLNVMVATVQCEGIANEKCASFLANEEWRKIEEEALQSGPMKNFGRKLSSILNAYLSEYDAETTYFDEGVRTGKRKQLEEKLLQLVQPTHQSIVEHIRSHTFKRFVLAFASSLYGRKGFAVAARCCIEDFMSLFDKTCAEAVIEQADWDSSKVRDKLRCDIDAHVAAVRTAKLSELTTICETKLNEALADPVGALLDEADDNTWPKIRELVRTETRNCIACFAGFTDFRMDEETEEKIREVEAHARGLVEFKARAKATVVFLSMESRFLKSFNGFEGIPWRVWTGNKDIRAATITACSLSLKLLSVMAAVRLDDEADNIENTLYLALVDRRPDYCLISNSWEKVPRSKTILTPFQCKTLWGQLTTQVIQPAVNYVVYNASSVEENKWWVILGEAGAFAWEVASGVAAGAVAVAVAVAVALLLGI